MCVRACVFVINGPLFLLLFYNECRLIVVCCECVALSMCRCVSVYWYGCARCCCRLCRRYRLVIVVVFQIHFSYTRRTQSRDCMNLLIVVFFLFFLAQFNWSIHFACTIWIILFIFVYSIWLLPLLFLCFGIPN